MDEILNENYETSKKKTKRAMLFFIITTIILLCLSVIFIILYVLAKKENETNDNNKDNPVPEKDYLTLWNNFEAKKNLTEYIGKITKKGKFFVPKEDRIAVFDFDGTLFQETDPMYLDHKLFVYRILEDPLYKDIATNEQIDLALKIKKYGEEDKMPSLSKEHAVLNAEIYANMTIEEFYNYTKNYTI